MIISIAIHGGTLSYPASWTYAISARGNPDMPPYSHERSIIVPLTERDQYRKNAEHALLSELMLSLRDVLEHIGNQALPGGQKPLDGGERVLYAE